MDGQLPEVISPSLAPVGQAPAAAAVEHEKNTPVSGLQPPQADKPEAVKTARVRGKNSETKNTSKAWDHFTLVPETVKTDNPMAACNYCKKKYFASTRVHGTSNLLKHIELGKCKEYQKILDSQNQRQKTLVFYPSSKLNGGDGTRLASFNASECRKSLARMIFIDEMPFRTVEAEGFRQYSMALQPKFVLPSRSTVQRDCLKFFEDEKAKLKSLLKSQRVCLTTDTWTSIQNLNYMCLTSHWIDNQWKLHKRILSFPTIANHKGETIGLAIMTCLKDWDIEKVFTITVDNASTNDGAIKHVIRRTKDDVGTVLQHKYIHMRCCAHILNLIVQEGLKEVDDAIIKIRNAVRYVRSSPARMQSFLKCVEEENISCKNRVCLDVETRWNSAYHMLAVAEKFEKAFDKLECEDSRYSSYFYGAKEETPEDTDVISRQAEVFASTRGRGRKRQKLMGPPGIEDWKNARCLVEFLKLFYIATLKFSGTQHVTSNNFFHELVALQQGIVGMTKSDDHMLSSMDFRMLGKFTKYWVKVENLNSLLHIAVVLDPRYKIRYVELCMRDIYDNEAAETFAKTLEAKFMELYVYYLKETKDSVPQEQTSASSTAAVQLDISKVDPAKAIRLKFAKDTASPVISGANSEAQRYLSDVAEPDSDDFDILMWWKVNSSKYPVIARMANDVLAVPISTVASESTFSTSGRVLDPYRSSLAPKTVEALICCQDWLRATPKDIEPKNDDNEFMEVSPAGCGVGGAKSGK